jgi:hypothetical protein
MWRSSRRSTMFQAKVSGATSTAGQEAERTVPPRSVTLSPTTCCKRTTASRSKVAKVLVQVTASSVMGSTTRCFGAGFTPSILKRGQADTLWQARREEKERRGERWREGKKQVTTGCGGGTDGSTHTAQPAEVEELTGATTSETHGSIKWP